MGMWLQLNSKRLRPTKAKAPASSPMKMIWWTSSKIPLKTSQLCITAYYRTKLSYLILLMKLWLASEAINNSRMTAIYVANQPIAHLLCGGLVGWKAEQSSSAIDLFIIDG